MGKSIEAPINQITQFSSLRLFVSTEDALTAPQSISPVANHEMRHAIVGRETGANVRLVTIVAGIKNGIPYRGLTELDRYSGPAAAASVGLAGNEADKQNVAASGDDYGKMATIARGIIDAQSDVILEGGAILDEEKSIGSSQIDEAYRRVKRRREGIFVASLVITDESGDTHTIDKLHTRRGALHLSEKELSPFINDEEPQKDSESPKEPIPLRGYNSHSSVSLRREKKMAA